MEKKFTPPAAKKKFPDKTGREDKQYHPRGEYVEEKGERGAYSRKASGHSPAIANFRDRKSGGKSSFPDKNRREDKQYHPRGEYVEEKGERIAKRLARLGLASRREAEMMIAAGRVAVNGRILASPAFNIVKTDIVTVDGKALPVKERTRLWLYHKPAGFITTLRDDEGRPTIFDNLPEILPRVVSVGRLDMNTEGLLLLTNDGGLARILELPSTGWVRHYRVRAHGKTSQQQLDSLKDGIAVDGIFYGAAEAVLEREQGSNVWLSIALREGKNREIKIILGALGLSVTRLIRTSFGPFQLGDLEVGTVREVRGRILRDQLGARLVEEANLDFDAPVINPFPNAPVAARPARSLYSPRRDFAGKCGRHNRDDEEGEGWISSGGRRPAKPGEVQEKPQGRAVRNANVWHAPGSRLQTAKRARFDRNEKSRDGDFAARPGGMSKAGGVFAGKKPFDEKGEGRFETRGEDREDRPKYRGARGGQQQHGERRKNRGNKPHGQSRFAEMADRDSKKPFGGKLRQRPGEGAGGKAESDGRNFSGKRDFAKADKAKTGKEGGSFGHGRPGQSKSGRAAPDKGGRPKGGASVKRGRHADNRR